jgi:hypothetical protein
MLSVGVIAVCGFRGLRGVQVTTRLSDGITGLGGQLASGKVSHR